MTIDKAISHLDTYSSTMGSGQTTQAQHEEAKRAAIDIMCKYQKIEQIYNSWRTGDYKGSKECMEDIGEVIKDGNNNS